MREWHNKYKDEGLVIIGNHYPEFSYEEDLDNLKQALIDLDVPYAVAQDNDRATWSAYKNRYWPTLYLIDKRGHIRYVHIGEGRYAETEAAIQELLAESYPYTIARAQRNLNLSFAMTTTKEDEIMTEKFKSVPVLSSEITPNHSTFPVGIFSRPRAS